MAYVDGSVVDECVDACFDDVLVHVFEGAVSFQFADSPVVHAFAGVADETAWKVGLSCGGTIRVYVEKVD